MKVVSDKLIVFTGNVALISVPQSVDTVAASLVELKCVVRVDPRELSRLRVTWFKDDTPLDDSRITTTVSSDPSSDNEAGFVLMIAESVPSDTGRYTCRATTDVETVEHTVQLLVKGIRGTCNCQMHVWHVSEWVCLNCISRERCPLYMKLYSPEMVD